MHRYMRNVYTTLYNTLHIDIKGMKSQWHDRNHKMFSVEFHEIWISSCICVLRVCTHWSENHWIMHVVKNHHHHHHQNRSLHLIWLRHNSHTKSIQNYRCPWRCQSKTELIFHSVFCILFGRFTNRTHHSHKLLGIFLKDEALYELHATFWTGHMAK